MGGLGRYGTLGIVTVVARVEHVGSLLRPGFLRDAREAHARGELAPAGLKAAEDRAVREVVAMQEEIGAWHSAEVGDVTIERPAGLAVIAPLRKRRNLAAEEFTFLRGCTGRQAKVTPPSALLTFEPIRTEMSKLIWGYLSGI